MSLKKLILVLLLCTFPAQATTYYIANASTSPVGSDSNNGTSPGTPWLTPNHAVNCGDIIIAAASTAYSAANFGVGKWGTVTCPGNNNVAWVKCTTFDACKITSTTLDAVRIDQSYWGIQGWEATTTGSGLGCFTAHPSNSTTTIHHIIFANDIANVCTSNGFNSYNNGTGASVDYLTIIGNIAYNAATGNANCYSGISIYQPKQSDGVAGTHIYVAGNFSYANLDPSPCSGGTPSDGEGIIFDTWDFSQGGGTPYAQQGVAYNNMLLGNGGQGFEANNNNTTPHATIYAEYNTSWGNATDAAMNATFCGQFLVGPASFGVTVLHDLAMTTQANGCGANPLYAYYIGGGNGTDTIDNSWGYSAAGHNEGINSSSGFAYGGGMNVGTNPAFVSAATPGAPSCGSATSVPNCMATVIANFVPTAGGSTAFGYQAVSNTSVVDPLYPVWLCTVTNLPTGLVTPGCGAPANNPSVSGVAIQ